jgi:hypothetical protein
MYESAMGPTFKERAAGLTNRTILIALLPAGLVYVAFAYYGDDGRAVAAASMLYVMTGAIRFFWDLRRYAWFWVAMLTLGAVHAALVVAMPWGNGPYRIPLLAILFPVMALDFSIIYWCVKLGENVIGRPATR